MRLGIPESYDWDYVRKGMAIAVIVVTVEIVLYIW